MNFKMWQFENATVVQPRINDKNQTVIGSDGKILNEIQIPGENTEPDSSRINNTSVLEKSVGALTIVTVVEHQKEIEKYVPKNSEEHPELRHLTVDQYEGLTRDFKNLYIPEQPETFNNVIEEVVSPEQVPYELEWDFLVGKNFTSWLHGIILPCRARNSDRYSSSSTITVHPKLENNLPLDLTTSEILVVLESLNRGLKQESKLGALVNITLNHMYVPGEVNIKFFTEVWDKKFKKRLSTKANGRPYADRRGTMVPDYPETAGEAVITMQDIASWWNSINGNNLTDEQKHQALNGFMKQLCKVS